MPVFFDADGINYATGSQCANSLPLVLSICDPTNRESIVDRIAGDVRARGNANSAGDVGYRYLLQAFEKNCEVLLVGSGKYEFAAD